MVFMQYLDDVQVHHVCILQYNNLDDDIFYLKISIQLAQIKRISPGSVYAFGARCRHMTVHVCTSDTG